jgi:CTP synthase
MANRVRVHIRWIDAELFEQDDSEIAARLEPMNAILVPGGFGERGSEGKIASVRFARERNVPFFGICLGMQMACIEGARNTAGSPRPARPNSARRLSRWSASSPSG